MMTGIEVEAIVLEYGMFVWVRVYIIGLNFYYYHDYYYYHSSYSYFNSGVLLP